MFVKLEQGELEHRNIKRRYMHTNKQRFIDQMVNRDIVEKVHEKMSNEVDMAEATIASDSEDSGPRSETSSGEMEGSPTGATPCGVNPHMEVFPGQSYRIAQDQSRKLYLPHFLKEPKNVVDPAFKVCTTAACRIFRR